MTNSSGARDAVAIPLRYPTALIFLDESGSKATASQFFVMAAVKLRQPGKFARALRAMRDRRGFGGELKFSEITNGTLPIYYEVIDLLQLSDAHLAACVVDGKIYNPFKGRAAWRAHADVAAQLLVGCINRRELVSILLDGISTPQDCSLEDTVRAAVNRRLGNTSVITAACLDSKTNDTLQVADLVAGAVSFQRRMATGRAGRPTSGKAMVSARLGAAFDCVGFPDSHNERVNVATYRGRSRPKTAATSRAKSAERLLMPSGR